MNKSKLKLLGPFFLVILVLFLAILVFFYLQSLQTVEAVLNQQIADFNKKVASEVDTRYEWLDRESKLLSRNRELRGIFSPHKEITQTDISEINEFILWFRQNAELDYLTIVYTDDKARVVYDSELSGTGNSIKMSNASVPTTNRYTEAIFTAFQAVEVLESKQLFVKILTQNASDDLLILRRATKMRGHNGVLYAVLSWQSFIEVNLASDSGMAFFDRKSSKMVYASDRTIASAIPIGNGELTEADFSYNKHRYLFQSIALESPWSIVTFINATNYLEKPQRLGRITLIVSLLFIGLSALIIWFLISKVRLHTNDLEEANNSIILQNEELQKARAVVEAHNKKLEEELATASSMQMDLMPNEDPQIEGLSIAGFCRPATQVGGDFYQYYERPNGKLSVVLADVTGHGMEAAIPNVLFSGMLDNMMESD